MTACDCWRAEREAQQLLALPRLSNLSASDLALRLSSLSPDRGPYTRQMLAAAKAFAAEPYGMLTLWGGPGNGKTAVLIALVNHFNGVRFGQALYTRFVDLMDAIRAGYKPGADLSAQTRYERLRTLWLLAIDEIDKGNMTAWADEFRTRFLDDRYRLGRERSAHTVLALNAAPASLPEPIFDRLRWGTATEGGFRIIRNEDPSARRAGL